MGDPLRGLRRRTYEVLEVSTSGDMLSRVVDLSLIVLISANVGAVVLESMPALFTSYRELFIAFEQVSLVVFSAEYALRLWAAREAPGAERTTPAKLRWSYARSPQALVDLAAIAPFYLSAVLPLDLRFLRVLRLLRVFKLTRYSGAMNMLLEVLYRERRGFGAALSILAIVMVFAASGIYLAEHEAQPVAFGSIPASMWWAVATLTTVGYGDVTPITPLGRMFAATITIVGIGIVALPAGLLAAGFSEVQKRNRERLEAEADQALEDGRFSADERQTYASLAQRLGVAPELAEEIVARARGEGELGHLADACPHCGKALT